MSIFKRILFAGDLSERSRAAFQAACSLAAGSDAHLHVLHVVEPVLMAGSQGPAGDARVPAFLPPDTHAHRDEIEAQMRGFYRAAPTIAVDYRVEDGHAVDLIPRIADDLDADLIVLGTHGRAGVDRMLCGSVAESVMRRSSRPVLVARGPEVARAGGAIRVILHPTDYSPGSWPALGVARAMARANDAELVLMHAAPAEVLAGGAFYAPSELRPEREELAKLQEQTSRAGLAGHVRARFTQGDAVDEILMAARETSCDLMVLGSHGRSGVMRLLMGSVAESVCRRAPCLTLIVRDAPGPRSDEEADLIAVGHAAHD